MSAQDNYSFVDAIPYQVLTSDDPATAKNTALAKLEATYDNSSSTFTRGCCSEAEITGGTCEAFNKNPLTARLTKNYREKGRIDY